MWVVKNSDCSEFPSKPDGFPEEFGLTKREYFAAMAMQGLLSHGGYSGFELAAYDAAVAADSLLKELEENECTD